MSERLIESERRFIASMAPNEEAKRLGPRLADIGAEIVRRARTDAEREMAEFEEFRLERAYQLLRILDTEVTRLRLAIGCHRDGRLSAAALWKMPDNWNGSPPTATPQAQP